MYDDEIIIVHCSDREIGNRISLGHKIVSKKTTSYGSILKKPHTKRSVHDIVRPGVPIKRKKKSRC